MDAKYPMLEEVANEIRDEGDVMAYAIVRRDGIMITHGLASCAEPHIVAALIAAISGTALLATERLRLGRFLHTNVECEHGKILVTEAGKQALFLTLVFPEANLALVIDHMEKIGRKIEDFLDNGESPPTLSGGR